MIRLQTEYKIANKDVDLRSEFQAVIGRLVRAEEPPEIALATAHDALEALRARGATSLMAIDGWKWTIGMRRATRSRVRLCPLASHSRGRGSTWFVASATSRTNAALRSTALLQIGRAHV